MRRNRQTCSGSLQMRDMVKSRLLPQGAPTSLALSLDRHTHDMRASCLDQSQASCAIGSISFVLRPIMRPTKIGSRVLAVSLGCLSATFGTLAFIGAIRAVYTPSPGLVLSVFLFSVAAIGLAFYVLNRRSPENRR